MPRRALGGAKRVKRVVQPELLDVLSPEHPAAARARRDLQRLNRLLRHHAILERALRSAFREPPRRLIELGAGDGALLLGLARARYADWHGVEVILVDRQPVVNGHTLNRFREFGWRAEPVVADAREWMVIAPQADAVVANLFLHHFDEGSLRRLFEQIAPRTRLFVACETRRDGVSWLGARLLGLLGCHAVTRHDARRSVAAGFQDGELSALWPERGWELRERRVAVFTHLFVARRREDR